MSGTVVNTIKRVLGLMTLIGALLAVDVDTAFAQVRHIGSRLELFVDDWLIDRMDGVRLTLHRPVPRERAIVFDKPWEGPWSAYATVMRDGDRFRMYYRGARPKGPEVTCYAESTDGIVWRKPALGLHAFDGVTDTNIVWTGPGAHNFTPFLDANPAAPADQRYKAVGAHRGLLVLVSPDALHWRLLRPEPVFTKGAFDSQNLAFWDTTIGRYVCYFRTFHDGVRAISRTTSTDFIEWQSPRPIDTGSAPREHFYTNATVPYPRAPHIYLSFPMRFVPDRKAVASHDETGVSDGVFMSSRDGIHFDRRFMEAFFRAGPDEKNWLDRNNMPVRGIVQTGPTELSMYVSRHYRSSDAHLQRCTLRVDGFVSVNAPYAGGEFVTRPLVFAGRALVLNYATSAVGSIRVEVQDESGQALPGFELAGAEELYGDHIERVVNWKPDADLSKLAGRPVRLRFVMRDADLYSIRFAKP